MKRVIGIALSAVAFLALASCASAETTSTAVTSSIEDTKQHDSIIAVTETGSSIIVVEESPADTEPTRVDEEINFRYQAPGEVLEAKRWCTKLMPRLRRAFTKCTTVLLQCVFFSRISSL